MSVTEIIVDMAELIQFLGIFEYLRKKKGMESESTVRALYY